MGIELEYHNTPQKMRNYRCQNNDMSVTNKAGSGTGALHLNWPSSLTSLIIQKQLTLQATPCCGCQHVQWGSDIDSVTILYRPSECYSVSKSGGSVFQRKATAVFLYRRRLS